MAFGKGKIQFSVGLPTEYIIMLDADSAADNRARSSFAAKVIMDHYNSLSPEEKRQKAKDIENYVNENTELFETNPEMAEFAKKAIEKLRKG